MELQDQHSKTKQKQQQTKTKKRCKVNKNNKKPLENPPPTLTEIRMTRTQTTKIILQQKETVLKTMHQTGSMGVTPFQVQPKTMINTKTLLHHHSSFHLNTILILSLLRYFTRVHKSVSNQTKTGGPFLNKANAKRTALGNYRSDLKVSSIDGPFSANHRTPAHT